MFTSNFLQGKFPKINLLAVFVKRKNLLDMVGTDENADRIEYKRLSITIKKVQFQVFLVLSYRIKFK